jgi:hypothetical protein
VSPSEETGTRGDTTQSRDPTFRARISGSKSSSSAQPEAGAGGPDHVVATAADRPVGQAVALPFAVGVGAEAAEVQEAEAAVSPGQVVVRVRVGIEQIALPCFRFWSQDHGLIHTLGTLFKPMQRGPRPRYRHGSPREARARQAHKQDRSPGQGASIIRRR